MNINSSVHLLRRTWDNSDERSADVSSLIQGSRSLPEGSLLGCHFNVVIDDKNVFDIADQDLSPTPSLLSCVILNKPLNFRSVTLLLNSHNNAYFVGIENTKLNKIYGKILHQGHSENVSSIRLMASMCLN